MSSPILQFGTGRFLQAHVDLMVSEALGRGEALGGITVVQSTDSVASTARLAALARPEGFPVRVRGLLDGDVIDTTTQVTSVRETLHAATQWPLLLAHFEQARVVVSNTADDGFRLDARDDAFLPTSPARVPASFPARLLVLLHHRWRHRPHDPLTLMPTELVPRNGDTLRDIVCGLAAWWALPLAFADWLRHDCTWVNSLVDRIVSAPLLPAGAITEPYLLWAVEAQAGMTLPCAHPALVVTRDLQSHERLKLFILNLGHTCLADRWLRMARPPVATVREAMAHPQFRTELEEIWMQEVLPVFEAIGLGDAAHDYLAVTRERFSNPFLDHALADIAQNHAQKVQRRVRPLLTLGAGSGLPLETSRLAGLLETPPAAPHSFPTPPAEGN